MEIEKLNQKLYGYEEIFCGSDVAVWGDVGRCADQIDV